MNLTKERKAQNETLSGFSDALTQYESLLLTRPSFSALHKLLLDSITMEFCVDEVKEEDTRDYPALLAIPNRLLAISDDYFNQLRSRQAELLCLVHKERTNALSANSYIAEHKLSYPSQGNVLIAVIDSSLQYDTILPQLILDAWSLHRDDRRAVSLLLAPSLVADALKELFVLPDSKFGVDPESAITVAEYQLEDPVFLETAFALWSPFDTLSPYTNFHDSYRAAHRLLQKS